MIDASPLRGDRKAKGVLFSSWRLNQSLLSGGVRDGFDFLWAEVGAANFVAPNPDPPRLRAHASEGGFTCQSIRFTVLGALRLQVPLFSRPSRRVSLGAPSAGLALLWQMARRSPALRTEIQDTRCSVRPGRPASVAGLRRIAAVNSNLANTPDLAHRATGSGRLLFQQPRTSS